MSSGNFVYDWFIIWVIVSKVLSSISVLKHKKC